MISMRAAHAQEKKGVTIEGGGGLQSLSHAQEGAGQHSNPRL